MSLVSYLILRISARGARWLSPILMSIAIRIMGLLLAAVAIQFMLNAIRAFRLDLPGLAQVDLRISRKSGSHRVIPHGEDRAHRVASLHMKKILLLIAVAGLLSTTGCLVSDGGRGRHENARYEHHDDVIIGPPVLVVRPPEVVVRPPEVIVR